MKGIFLITGIALLAFGACKEKATKAPPPEPVIEEVVEIAEPDTLYQEQVVEEPVYVPEPDKYFLIAASFVEYDNAQRCQSDLLNRGMRSEIIQRSHGPNSNFYRVSYMSFNDKREALRTLNNERNQEGKENVWLLVKR
ncbi:SPOR domain-containing protein [Alkalitalea saponilacus]|uniref:Sporulation related domain-containing protein n=1 Tax=Alkalitalea saponilacus TaxID=889453 RepID=A0A1T5HTD1_9BACT|nr:SPOR domain-containing protein [Alkalitalea saponilacus]ASB48932.1 SPOR domain-containing protein [Alkalitalea saponilacus]SKC23923.1 Sporulation related domain-containing protein [Alkalitalea saponilacus]